MSPLASIAAVGACVILNVPISICSRTEWYCAHICLVREWKRDGSCIVGKDFCGRWSIREDADVAEGKCEAAGSLEVPKDTAECIPVHLARVRTELAKLTGCECEIEA